MMTFSAWRRFWSNLFGWSPQEQPDAVQVTSQETEIPPITIERGDPLLGYFREHSGAVEVDQITIDSPAVQQLREASVKLVVPMISRGEVVGLLNLGSRLSTQEYSPDDFLLLNSLVTQAAPAMRVAQLAELQKVEALQAERLRQEMRVARLIQKTLLPKELPELPGWQVAAFYQPARAVGGDFYDFIYFDDGRIGFVIGDVTDKGMPAALLMATTRATLRTMAQRYVSPGEVLRQTNEALCPDVPPSMFVTCMYALLDPKTGRAVYANAGHNLPYRCGLTELSELKATGMPLGLLPGMIYDEYETVLEPGERLFLYSDGLVEAHSKKREMYSNDRLEADLRGCPDGSQELIESLISHLWSFTGSEWEQEDDITIVILDRKLPAREHETTN
jgi:serine phosphatase RsbU (regulator of sigma subunit)